MTKSICKQLRLIAFHRQNHKCFYCELPIWEEAVEYFAAKHGISIAQAKLRRSTAEHLVAQKDGGLDTPGNIVAACAWCNSRRHAGRSNKAPEPQVYKCRIVQRMAVGKWHPAGSGVALNRNESVRGSDCRDARA
ncbi:HNH endonuclease [Polaromonas sp. AER18D-145]|uniref:HNH endonuclease n=1 Tax=Polaromonas sp. AER18D-145 TaxID=1977060 RepID=UPI0011411F75|nr:HNH endonuclease [Polaromonas sp. AER18D-145]